MRLREGELVKRSRSAFGAPGAVITIRPPRPHRGVAAVASSAQRTVNIPTWWPGPQQGQSIRSGGKRGGSRRGSSSRKGRSGFKSSGSRMKRGSKKPRGGWSKRNKSRSSPSMRGSSNRYGGSRQGRRNQRNRNVNRRGGRDFNRRNNRRAYNRGYRQYLSGCGREYLEAYDQGHRRRGVWRAGRHHPALGLPPFTAAGAARVGVGGVPTPPSGELPPWPPLRSSTRRWTTPTAAPRDRFQYTTRPLRLGAT